MTLDTINYSAIMDSFFSLANCQDARISRNVTHFKIKGVCRKLRLLHIASQIGTRRRKILGDSISCDLDIPESLLDRKERFVDIE
jgi:hypothetical protein